MVHKDQHSDTWNRHTLLPILPNDLDEPRGDDFFKGQNTHNGGYGERLKSQDCQCMRLSHAGPEKNFPHIRASERERREI